eukprot:365187-Chlamydomonas_euryale.AAC.17
MAPARGRRGVRMCERTTCVHAPQVLHCGRALPITVTLASLISRAFPAEYQERKEEEDASAASRPVGTAGRTSSSQDTAAINGVVTMPVFGRLRALPLYDCLRLALVLVGLRATLVLHGLRAALALVGLGRSKNSHRPLSGRRQSA